MYTALPYFLVNKSLQKNRLEVLLVFYHSRIYLCGLRVALLP